MKMIGENPTYKFSGCYILLVCPINRFPLRIRWSLPKAEYPLEFVKYLVFSSIEFIQKMKFELRSSLTRRMLFLRPTNLVKERNKHAS